MPSNIDLYTTGNMETVSLQNAPSEAAGFPIENAFDNNPDTYWKPTSSSAVDIEMDFGVDITADALVLLIKDYDTDYSAAGCFVALQGSADGITWTPVVITSLLLANDTGSPVYINEFSSLARRYWRLQIGAGSNVPELSGIFLCKTNTVSQGNQWPEPDMDEFIGNNRDAVLNFSRTYKINGTTFLDALRDAFLDSRRGDQAYPVILQEGSVDSDSVICKFAERRFNRNQIAFELFQPTIRFIGLPYIRAGQNY